MRRWLVVVLWVMGCAPAWAAPVPQGALPEGVLIFRGKKTLVQQRGERAVIDWRSFDLQADERVVFMQPGAGSATLNRIVGGNPSVILGRIEAPGRVLLINPNGIVFGAGSVVDVGALVASTLTVTRPEDFLAGRPLDLAQQGPSAFLILQGSIRAGSVVLAAPLVASGGAVDAPGGTVTLAATRAATVTEGGVVVGARAAGPFGDVRIPAGAIYGPDAVSEYVLMAVKDLGLVAAGDVVMGTDGSVTLTGAEGLLVQTGRLSVSDPVGGAPGAITVHSTQVTFANDDSRLLAGPGGSIVLESQGSNALEAGEVRQTDGLLLVTPEPILIEDEDAPPGAGPDWEREEARLEGEEEVEHGEHALGGVEVEFGELETATWRVAPRPLAATDTVAAVAPEPGVQPEALTVGTEVVILGERAPQEAPPGPAPRLVKRQITGTQMTRKPDPRSLMRRLYGPTRTLPARRPAPGAWSPPRT